jgi:hypothetical protein
LSLAAGQLESLPDIGRLDKDGIQVNVVTNPITGRIDKPQGLNP